MKSLLVFLSFCGFALVAAAGAVSWLGLDNNALYNSADTALETVQPEEEIGFRNVADLIASFVKKQRALRSLEASDSSKSKEEQRIAGDLPTASYATRDVHRKSNGCFAADLRISPSLSLGGGEMGVFQPGAQYDAIVRFSNGHPLNRPDALPDARGFAVKILPSSTLSRVADAETLNSATLLDILSINFPTFFVNEHDTAKKYLSINQHFLHGTYDFRNNFAKTKITEGLSTFASGLSTMELRLALLVNGSVIVSPLYQDYFSMVPSRLGPPGTKRAVKYIWQPVACGASQRAAFTDSLSKNWPEWSKSHDYADPLASLFKSNPAEKGDYLRANATAELNSGDACFALMLQPFIDQASTNIEDSSDIWLRSESERAWWLKSVVPGPLSPYWVLGHQKRADVIARVRAKAISKPVLGGVLRIKRLNGEVAGNSKTCEDLSFNPWNGDVYHHKPLGVISRLKRRVYNASRRMRHALNDVSDVERQDTK